MDHDIDIPPYFLCPISLEIMKDPVTVSTGITYDRESIEKWLFSESNKTCPVTKQHLSDSTDLTPNHTLRRLIQSWCTVNASHGIERIPTPRPPISKIQISRLIKDATNSPQLQTHCLKSLRTIASESETNKRNIEAAGAVEFLASLLISNTASSTLQQDNPYSDDGFDFLTSVGDEALNVLHNLHVSEAGLRNLFAMKNGEFVDSLTRVLQRAYFESRAYAVLLLKSMFEVADPAHLASLRPELFYELVLVLKDQISQQASKATLKILIQTCPWGRNRIKVAEAGAVSVLVGLLLDSKERRPTEMILVLLDMLCACAEGRADLLYHAAGLAVVSKRILRVSALATEKAVRILFSISKFSATASLLQEMLHLGIVAKLGLVLEVDSGKKVKDKAIEILKMHARAWRDSSCIPRSLIASYPS